MPVVATYSIPSDHPALPGHFPGQPVVPAVVILNTVLDHAPCEYAQHAVLEQAKFLAPLLPDQTVTAVLTADGPRLRFLVKRGDTIVAQGTFLFGLPPKDVATA